MLGRGEVRVGPPSICCPSVVRLPGTEGVAYLHLHHWYWPLPLVHLCVFPTDVSMLAQVHVCSALVCMPNVDCCPTMLVMCIGTNPQIDARTIRPKPRKNCTSKKKYGITSAIHHYSRHHILQVAVSTLQISLS